MSKADLSHHIQLKHNSFKDLLKTKGLPILFDFDDRNTQNKKRKALTNTESRNTEKASTKKARVTNSCNRLKKEFTRKWNLSRNIKNIY